MKTNDAQRIDSTASELKSSVANPGIATPKKKNGTKKRRKSKIHIHIYIYIYKAKSRNHVVFTSCRGRRGEGDVEGGGKAG